jgi:hypothetical protein
MKINILEIAKNKGNDIAKRIVEKYDEADFSFSHILIEKEIYEISINYAKVFIFENIDNIDKEVRDELIFKVNTFIADKINLDKKSNDELLANIIKFYTINNLLEEYNIVI